ncbi:MAG: chromosome segregation protein SMC [Candidatus Obscuribacterales bacterium]|nr:chromosome segregation protein SMC [Candidatus Obscuribacterales bacterium]
MRIREIELDNFKSFGKLTTVPLLNGFTTISGPNGSGKSNIIDSLLFALGLSSTRTMRAERLPDLLNNLSGKNEARVTVRFTNDMGDEIEVCRRLRVKDSGYTSSYILNGKISTLSDVHDELGKYNVSPTGFNVIMQGDVTGIVTMSATERRKIIDELAGVAEFDRRIEQAEKELLAVAEKIEHQKIVLAEIAVRLVALQADRDQALKYLDLKSQKDKLERDLIYVRVKDLETKADAEQSAISELDAKEEQLGIDQEEAELTLLAHRAEIGRLEEEIKDKGGNEQLLLRQELENKRGDFLREESKLSNLNGVIGEKSKLQKSLLGQVKAIEKRLNELSRDKKQHDADLKAVQLVLMEKQGSLSAIQAEIEVLRKERDHSSSKGMSLHEDLQRLRDDRHKLDVRKAELKTRKEQLEKELEAARNAATESIGKSAALKNLIAGLERKLQDEQAMVFGLGRGIRQMESEVESTQEEIEQKRKELEQLNRRLIELETTRDVVGESGYGRAVEAVLNANIPGVLGTIGQLGRVDERYELALEVAIGGRLADIVVEDDAVAERCIRVLKENKAGRATFVPLNKIMSQPPGLLPNKPGVIDFAFNLVDFNPSYTRAFQYACGQTVIIDNIDNARKMINTARMVTLEGEILEKHGTMTGGTSNRNRLRFNQKDSNDLGSLKAKAKQIADDMRWLSDSLKELNATLNQDRNKFNQATATQSQKQAEFDNRKAELSSCEELIDSLKPRLRSMGDEIEAVDSEYSGIDGKADELTRQINKLQDELADLTAGGTRSELDRLLGEGEELKSEIESIEKGAKDTERLIDRIETEERVEQNNKQALNLQESQLQLELQQLNESKPVHESNIQALAQTIQELERKSAEISKELLELQASKDNLQKEITKVEIKKTRISEQLKFLEEERNKHKLAMHELKIQLAAARAELEHILSENPEFKPPSASTIEQLKGQIERLDRRMRALEPVNMKALEEYNQTRERQDELTEYLETLSTERDEINQRIGGYGELKKNTFMEAFVAIDHNFQEIFAELSSGHGKLELENPEDPFAGGLVIRAQPRGKKMARIEALSGGEKSLTALSFVFAFQRFAPAPFYAFDEVDMMLDGANAERLARMVKRQSEQAQFVAVSLRRPMIENADHAIGVSLRADGFSKVVGIAEIKIPEHEEQAVNA